MSIDYSLLIKESAAPLALVSGVGLVLLVVNARFMHVSDRLRSQLAASRGPGTAEENRWLFKRARWLRLSLLCLSGSILSTSFLVFCALWSRMVDEPHTAAVLFLVYGIDWRGRVVFCARCFPLVGCPENRLHCCRLSRGSLTNQADDEMDPRGV